MAQIDPKSRKEEQGRLTFTLSGCDVSYANAIRRTILSNIPIVVFKTSPYAENTADISINTTSLHNEIIKQRLSCIPICISDIENTPFRDYLLDLDVENKTDNMMIVTTGDFRIKNQSTGEYLDDAIVREIFPPFVASNGTEYFIDFVRLRPKTSNELSGGRIKLTCRFTIGTAKDDGSFNVTGDLGYGRTPDEARIKQQLEIEKQRWKDAGHNQDEIDFNAANWELLEGKRYVIDNSFDFVIKSVGIYSNEQIMKKACEILIEKLQLLLSMVETDDITIRPTESTMENSYDVILQNEDYTIGNMLNHELYTMFYHGLELLNYVGFKKMHPHDEYGILRMSLTDANNSVSSVKQMLNRVIQESIEKMVSIRKLF